MSDERFTEIVANIKTDNNIESDEDFELVLQQEQMTIDDLRRALERQFIIFARAADRHPEQSGNDRDRGARVLRSPS